MARRRRPAFNSKGKKADDYSVRLRFILADLAPVGFARSGFQKNDKFYPADRNFFNCSELPLLIFLSLSVLGTAGSPLEFEIDAGSFHLPFLIDGLSALFLLLLAVLTLAATVFSVDFVKNYEAEKIWKFYLALPFFIGGLAGLLTVDDLGPGFTLAWQLMVISSYFLVRGGRPAKVSARPALIYLIFMETAWLLITGSAFLAAGYQFGDSLATIGLKLASSSRLAAGIAHEINNPLTGVLTYSSLLLEELKGTPYEEDLKVIIEETLRCRKIVRGLLDFARDYKPEEVRVNLNTVIEETLQILENHVNFQNIRIIKNLDQALPEITHSGKKMKITRDFSEEVKINGDPGSQTWPNGQCSSILAAGRPPGQDWISRLDHPLWRSSPDPNMAF